MRKSVKFFSAVLAVLLVVGMLPFGSMLGMFKDNSFKVSAEENAAAEKPLITIGTIGDPHTDYGLQNNYPYVRPSFVTTMNALKEEGIDLLLVGGDMLSDNEDNSGNLRWEKSVYDRTINAYKQYSSAATKTGIALWACGNHDYEVGVYNDRAWTEGDYDSYQGFMNMMLQTAGQPKSVYKDSDYRDSSDLFADHWLGAHYVVQGFDFIIMNPPYRISTRYVKESLDWLDATLAEIGPEKTVFIIGHYPLYDNRGLDESDAIKDDPVHNLYDYTNFVNVMNKYDNAVYMYGHIHGGTPSKPMESTYITSDTFERITHYDANGAVVNDRSVNPTSFVTAYMGSPAYYAYSQNPGWLGAEDPYIIQAMTIKVYKNRIEFKMFNCGEREGVFRDLLTWTIKRDVLATGDVDITGGCETFELPMDWSTGTSRDSNGWDIPVMGNWSIGGFKNLDTATSTYKHSSATPEAVRDKSASTTSAPQSYLGNNYNESYVQNATITGNGLTGWYVNYAERWGGTVVKAGGSYMKATAVAGKPGAIVFTAPSDGYYSYSEIFRTVITTTGAEYEATVRRNGLILDRFEITTAGIDKTFEGKVMLNAGDKLMFAFEQKTTLATADDASHCANIQSIVVKKYPVPANYKGEKDLTPKFEIGSFTDTLGNVTLMGYDMSASGVGAEKLYPITSYEKTLDTDAKNPNKWIAIDPKGQNKGTYLWGGLKSGYNHLWAISSVTGYITDVGGAQETRNTGAALVFEAPQTGIYNLYAELGTTFCNTFIVYHDYIIMKGDGTELVNKNNVGAADSSKTVIETTVMLEKGEKVMILKLPNSSSAKFNTSCNGTAKIEITELEHICTADTIVDRTDAVAPDCANDGTVEYYTCYCDAIYGDANAEKALDSIVDPSTGHADEGEYTPVDNTTHKFNRACCDYEDATSKHDFVDGYCATCDYTCVHAWENGVCTNCKINCAHNWENGECAVCHIACNHDWNAENGVCNTCGLGCAHDWNSVNGKCNTCGYACQHTVTEDDATCLADAACDICGFVFSNPDNHINSKRADSNDNGTHKWLCNGCDAPVIENENCVYGDDYICDYCGYNNKPNVIIGAQNKVDTVIDAILNGETADVEVVGPTAPMSGIYDVVEYENVTGYEYTYINLEIDSGEVVLRHSFKIFGDVTVTLNGHDVELKQDEGYNTYYFDTYPVAGEYDVSNTIVVNGDTYYVSLYSYIKLALEGNVDLTDEQETLLKALYDLNEIIK